MANELTIIETDILNVDEKSELNANIDRIIEAHKNNRQEINRLVFESVAAMTEADQAQEKLSNKGFFRRFIGGITGSNQKLQNKINSNRAVVQYAAQQTLQKLVEQNLMTFDLITAVNNKLNASIYDVNTEFNRIYTGLEKFLKHSRNEIVRLETRLARVEQNVQLLTWQNSIEYLEFDGEEYLDMDDTKKIVCLTRDFFDITKGNWTTSDLLLLKTAMATIGIQPRAKVNYFSVLKEIGNNEVLKNKLLNGKELQPIVNPSYLIALGTLKKMESLKNEESYIVDTVNNYMNQYNIGEDCESICDGLTDKYLQEKALVNINIDVESYDMILDLLYNLEQAESENLIVSPLKEQVQGKEYLNEYEKMMYSAEQGDSEAQYLLGIMYEKGNEIEQDYEEAVKWYKESAKQGNSEAQYKLGYMYQFGDGVRQDYEEAVRWYKESAEQGNSEAQNNLGEMYYYGYGVEEDYEEAIRWYRKAIEQGNSKAQYNLGHMYEWGDGVKEDYKEAIKWYRKAAEQGNIEAQFSLGLMYDSGREIEQNYEEAVKWYKKAAEQGDSTAQCNLGVMYEWGKGVIQDKEEAVKWYRKAAEQGDTDAREALERLGVTV
ncbi:tetratricopeptide repeat protein [Megamonas hypermegale]|uniref:tetratricopeptide repeat protein n=1 Tax=Megamonas hypermegale TaxID=158847 RepID=UPI00195A6CD9|nr:tetratricopeptide repeat protein [Megamonas hypermegale]